MYFLKIGLIIFLFPLMVLLFNKVKEEYIESNNDFIFFMFVIMYVGLIVMISAL